MSTESNSTRLRWRDVGPVVIAAVVLLPLAVVLSATLHSDELLRWPFLVEWIGTAVLLAGVVALLAAPAPGAGGAALHYARPVAIILSGAILIGGGWSPALGLALLAATVVVVDRRSSTPDGGSSKPDGGSSK